MSQHNNSVYLVETFLVVIAVQKIVCHSCILILWRVKNHCQKNLNSKFVLILPHQLGSQPETSQSYQN